MSQNPIISSELSFNGQKQGKFISIDTKPEITYYLYQSHIANKYVCDIINEYINYDRYFRFIDYPPSHALHTLQTCYTCSFSLVSGSEYEPSGKLNLNRT
jgi:hypothetical protein